MAQEIGIPVYPADHYAPGHSVLAACRHARGYRRNCPGSGDRDRLLGGRGALRGDGRCWSTPSATCWMVARLYLFFLGALFLPEDADVVVLPTIQVILAERSQNVVLVS